MLSLEQRKARIFEDACVGCGGGQTMSVGDGGFTGDSDAAGPTAGYDPLMKKVDKFRKKRKNRIQPR